MHLKELSGSSLLSRVGPTPYTTHYTMPSTHRPCAISPSPALQCSTALQTQSLLQPPLPDNEARLQLRALRNDPPDDPGTQHAMQQATQRCQSTTSRVRQLKRSRWKKHQAALVQEITDAWRRRDFGKPGGGRLLGGSGVGSKKRSMAAPAPIYSQQEWAQFPCPPRSRRWSGSQAANRLHQPARPTDQTYQRTPQGRCGFCVAHKEATTLQQAAQKHHRPGLSLLQYGVSSWSAATPALPDGLALVQPADQYLPVKSNKAFHILHSSMLATCSTPHSWHRSGAFTTPKTNGKTGPAGQRLLHTLESLGKAYYAQVWKQLRAHYSRPYASGYLPHRRREQAILQQSLLRHRLQKAKVSHTTAFYDLANAFASASHCHTLQPVVTQSNLPPAEQQHLLQRLSQARGWRTSVSHWERHAPWRQHCWSLVFGGLPQQGGHLFAEHKHTGHPSNPPSRHPAGGPSP